MNSHLFDAVLPILANGIGFGSFSFAPTTRSSRASKIFVLCILVIYIARMFENNPGMQVPNEYNNNNT